MRLKSSGNSIENNDIGIFLLWAMFWAGVVLVAASQR